MWHYAAVACVAHASCERQVRARRKARGAKGRSGAECGVWRKWDRRRRGGTTFAKAALRAREADTGKKKEKERGAGRRAKLAREALG